MGEAPPAESSSTPLVAQIEKLAFKKITVIKNLCDKWFDLSLNTVMYYTTHTNTLIATEVLCLVDSQYFSIALCEDAVKCVRFSSTHNVIYMVALFTLKRKCSG